ncbi:MAG: hypothetical protein FWD85_10935 [Microbacteriaceae bacterium]|nr:hypothetical protein [Microbacteriaceae bacterium]MCL2795808.1 hypothetical protein [Microbacteriaceae bacterium]
MQKSGDGGVSHHDAGMDDESIATAMEHHFAPFASAKRNLAEAAAIAGQMDASREPDDDDDDPEITAITRKLDATHDTLGAITELQQLLIQRTGAIPVIQLPQAAAAAAAPANEEVEPAGRAEAEPVVEAENTPPREPEAEPTADPEAVHAAPADEVPGFAREEEPDTDSTPTDELIDWAVEPITEPANAPGFSPWVDPAAIAAAQDTQPARSYSDVSTQVFSVFSAERLEPAAVPEPEVAPAPEPAPQQPQPLPPLSLVPVITDTTSLAAETAPVEASAPIVAATGTVDITPRFDRTELDEDDGVVDDTDRADTAVAAEPAPPPALVLPAAPPPEPAAEVPRRRRWWPFGRR